MNQSTTAAHDFESAVLPDLLMLGPNSSIMVTNPSGNGLKYQPLEQDSIRLVHLLPSSTPTSIRCSLERSAIMTTNKTQTRPYKALSYCWGDPNSTKLITINGSSISITTNLWNALSTLIQHHDITQPFWIDAICINQHDISERNHQVKRMWQIYSSAEHVYAWLGSKDEHTDLAWHTLRRASKGCSSTITTDGSCGKINHTQKRIPRSGVIAGYLMTCREYFTRTWTLVEAINGSKVSILCGRYIMESSVFIHGILKFQSQALDIPFPTCFMPFLVARKRAFRRSTDDEMRYSGTDAYIRFQEPFSIFIRSNCSDPRDKIFAMLGDMGLRNSGLPLEDLGPDYRWTVDELVLIVIEFLTRLSAADSDKAHDVLSGIVLEEMNVAFGTPKTLREFRAWFHSHPEWTLSFKRSGTVHIGTGRIIDCSTPHFEYLLEDRNAKLPEFTMERSPSGKHAIITKYQSRDEPDDM